MADSDIEWTDKVWNVTRGCRRVSPGCGGPGNVGGCYAERQAIRHAGPGGHYEGLVKSTPRGPRWTGVGRFVVEKLTEPLRWRKPQKVFVNSMSDLFFEEFTNEEIAAVFGVMAACPQHTFQVLTKRAKRMREWFEWISVVADVSDIEVRRCLDAAEGVRVELHSRGLETQAIDRRLCAALGPPPRWPLPNVWLGVSCEDQQRADERIPDLLRTPAAVRFVSAEPLLGPVSLAPALGAHGYVHSSELRVDWVIVGAESGPGARPMDEDWVRLLRDQCAAARVSFFYKQKLDGRAKVSLPLLDDVRHAESPT